MNEQTQSREDVISRRMKQVFVLFASIGGFFIVAEHRAHLIPYLPLLFLAACPLMHVFMHHGHGAHQRHGSSDEPDRQRDAASAPGYTAPRVPGYSESRGPSQHPHGERS
jgi:hypothetical protein